MANRRFQKGVYHLDQNSISPVVLTAKITAAADVDANGYTVTEGKGITSVSKTEEGELRVVLQDKYDRLLYAGITHNLKALGATFVAEDVDGASPYVEFLFDNTDTNTDPDAATIYLYLVLANGPR